MYLGKPFASEGAGLWERSLELKLKLAQSPSRSVLRAFIAETAQTFSVLLQRTLGLLTVHPPQPQTLNPNVLLINPNKPL